MVTDNLRPFYVHEITLHGVKSKEEQFQTLHPTFYYTLNAIPDGMKLNASELSTKRTPKKVKKKTVSKKSVAAKNSAKAKILTDEEVAPLLTNNTCIACHNKSKRVIGPSFQEIAKRKYTNEQIVELIYNPQPKNWPEYATPMAPMPQVPKEEALKIAAWINSLSD